MLTLPLLYRRDWKAALPRQMVNVICRCFIDLVESSSWVQVEAHANDLILTPEF
jgi:hypothetical protein